MFEDVRKQSFSEREEEVQRLWDEQRIFKKQLEIDGPEFVFYDGPPFATGLPHYGHLLAGTIKDVVARYKVLDGYRVPRRLGWDCHGIPVESQIEKAHQLSGASSIETFGIGKFNEACRSIVLKYTNEWRSTIERMGRWADFEGTYRTMDPTYMESVWWVFKQLFEKGLVYEGYKVMPFSAKLATPLSNFEAGENYQDVDDPSLTITLPLVDEPDTALLVWTTTPWTLPSNLAAAVGPDIEYVLIQDHTKERKFILARERLSAYYKNSEEYDELKSFKGRELGGKRYEPPFAYFKDQPNAFQVLVDEFVSTTDGTGIVHCAPAFGESDFYACREANIELVCPVDVNGYFTEEIPEYAGKFVKEADKGLIKDLKGRDRVFLQATIRHRYPMCPRTDTPLIYRAVSSWFVSVEKIKDNILAANEQIHWVPGHLKKGRFGKWLEGARDWAISRNRYWGTPIPLWRSEDGEIHCIGSIEELELLTGKKIEDLHRHHIDELTFEKDGKLYRRIPEVFDCWFESGSMPYAQNHYPFENKALVEANFPADFIAEGLDQTRGWFYTLTVLAAALFNKPAFKNVIVNGILLAEDGNKMSKRLQNYPDPADVIKKYGADAIRLYLLNSPAVRGDDLRFSERGVELVLRQVMIPLWNAYSFFITYARIYNWTPKEVTPTRTIDRWILSKLNTLVKEVRTGMDAYDLNKAVEPFVGFVDQLTNWYIRRSRRRFWAEEDSPDRQEAFATLYRVLLDLTKIAAPFIPFITDAMYRNLKQKGMPESVHLARMPQVDESLFDQTLEQGMAAVQRAVSLGHALRKEHKIKVRQPLPSVTLGVGDSSVIAFLQEQAHLIQEELNVKSVDLTTDESKFVTLSAKPNFPLLGKRAGKQMKELQATIRSFDQQTLAKLRSGQSHTIELAGAPFELSPEEVDVNREVLDGLIAATEGGLTLALNTELNEELLVEGLAREIVNKINTQRRDMDFEVSDRISVAIETSERVQKAFVSHEAYIREEVLAVEVRFGPCSGKEWDLNGEPAKIEIARVARPSKV